METVNRPDEWKIEQGLLGAKLPILDQTGSETVGIQPQKWEELAKDDEAIQSVGDRTKLFARELEGWKGYMIHRIVHLLVCSF
jgi:sulfite oxidase